MRFEFYVLTYLCRVHLSIAHGIACTATQEAGETLYSVPEFTATNCHYYWTNITNHVLANHEGKIEELVVMNTNRSLSTRVCLEHIHYKRDCISEGMPHEANCTITCSGNAGRHRAEGVRRHHWFAVLSVAITLFLVAVALLWLICRKQRDNAEDADVEVQLV